MPDESGSPPASPLALSVVMPAFNEADIIAASVGHVVAGMRERGESFEILVVENGSTDATAARAAAIAADHPEVRVESLSAPDYGAALRHGLLAARGDIVVNFDCDYYDLDFLDAAVRALRAPGGPAIVVGSKRASGASDSRPRARRFVTLVFSLLLRGLFRVRVSDTHGMKAMRRDAVVPFARQCVFGRDLFDTELVLRVERGGLVSAEVPVAVAELRPARTPIARRVPRAVLGLARLRLQLWRERR